MEDKEIDYMNVIPLVDVMLVLLTIVLTTSTFIATGAISVTLPKSSETVSETPFKGNIVVIDNESAIFFDDTPVTMQELQEKLKNIPKNSPIILRADRSIQLQTFIDVMDEIKKMGFEKLSIQTEKKGGE